MKHVLIRNPEFTVEPYKGKLRFVMYEQGEEFVCRIERKKNIEAFLQGEDERIFKGRLQLQKHNHEILIVVKGKVIAAISMQEFSRMIFVAAVKDHKTGN